MSKKKWALVIFIVLICVIGLMVYRSYSAKPAPFDTEADLRALEQRMIGDTYDSVAWEIYAQVARDIEQQGEDQAVRIATRRDVDAGAIDFRHAVLALTDSDDLRDVEGSRELVSWYVASDLPVRLTDALRAPGLRAPSLTEQGEVSIVSELDDALMAARRVCFAESGRLHRAMVAGDAATVAECAENIDTLARIQASQPLAVTLLVGEACWSTLGGAVETALHDGTMTPEIARVLIPIYFAWLRDEPARSAGYLAGEKIGLRATLEDAYTGQLQSSWGLDLPPRIVWLNHKTIDARTVDYFEALESIIVSGTATTNFPSLPWDEHDALDRLRSGPLTALLPAIERLAGVVFHGRARRGASLLHMAIVVHQAEHAEPPADLNTLVTSGVLTALPTDPYAPDGAFRYRVDATSPSGFVLYSVGFDGIDDGGVRGADGPWPDRIDRMPAGTDAVWMPNRE